MSNEFQAGVHSVDHVRVTAYGVASTTANEVHEVFSAVSKQQSTNFTRGHHLDEGIANDTSRVALKIADNIGNGAVFALGDARNLQASGRRHSGMGAEIVIGSAPFLPLGGGNTRGTDEFVFIGSSRATFAGMNDSIVIGVGIGDSHRVGSTIEPKPAVQYTSCVIIGPSVYSSGVSGDSVWASASGDATQQRDPKGAVVIGAHAGAYVPGDTSADSNANATNISSAGTHSVAIGYNARVVNESLAIGSHTTATGHSAIAIGVGVYAEEKQIVLGVPKAGKGPITTKTLANWATEQHVAGNLERVSFAVGGSGLGSKGDVLTCDGPPTAFGGGTIWAAVASSRKVKRDIEELTLNEAQDQFDAIEPKTFTYTDDARWPGHAGTRQAGFIAEEIADTGMFVEVDENGDPRDLSERNLIAVLWKVVKDQQARIAALEARLP